MVVWSVLVLLGVCLLGVVGAVAWILWLASSE